MESVINPQILEVRTYRGIKYIPVIRIIYIKAEKKESVIHLDNNKLVNARYLLKWYSGVLSTPDFFRCHNSYIINCKYVDCFCSKEIILVNNIHIPLSRNKLKSLKENLVEIQLKTISDTRE